MIIHPSFILSQGKHKGYSLSEVYQYDPTYINWMVEFIQGFEINIDEFYNLPKPTVSVPPVNKTKIFAIESFYRTLPNASVADLKQAKYLTEIDFKFSEQTIKILSEKKNGTYIAPKW